MTSSILQHLKLPPAPPSLAYLQALIVAYCTYVPWESASKIVKKSYGSHPQECVRLEDAFWTQALESGTGGTCYESNLAFFKLLEALGFQGYLTINQIKDKSSVHSAIVITINKAKYIADIGYPLYAAIPLIEQSTGEATFNGIQYRATQVAENEYLIENFPHPKPYLYHLSDTPISTTDYLNVCSNDYGEDGLFADRIIIRKLMNNIPTRFDSADLPYNIHELHNGAKTKNYIPEATLVNSLSAFYGIHNSILAQGFAVLNKTGQE